MSFRDLFSTLAGIQETVLLSPANVAGPAPLTDTDPPNACSTSTPAPFRC